MSASLASPSEDTAAADDWLGDAADLRQFLRERGLEVGTGEFLLALGLVQRLRENVAQEAALPPEQAALWLAPVLCGTAAEQSALAPLLTAYARARRMEMAPQPARPWPVAPCIADRSTPPLSRVVRHLLIIAVTLLLVLGAGLVVWFIAGYPEQFRSYLPAVPPFINGGLSGAWLERLTTALTAAIASLDWLRFAVLPPLVWLLILRRRRGRRPALQRIQGPDGQPRQQVLVGGNVARLFQDTDLSQPLQAMRAHRMTESTRIDPRGSVRATIAAAGRLSLVTQARPQLPDYPIVITERSRDDHLAALAQALAARLREERVEATLYAFSESLDLMRTSGAWGSVGLEELIARHGGEILLLVDDGSAFWDPMTGAASRRTNDMLDAWEKVILLTPVPARRWSWRERQLAEAGMIVLPATDEGLALMGDFLRGRQEPPRPALRHRPVRSALAELSDPDSVLTLLRDSPMPSEPERREVVEAIAHDMPKQAFDIACVLALFPEIRIDLTMHALNSLPDRGAAPLSREEVFGALASLPWFRYGRTPDWLRLELALCLDDERRREAARFYAAWLKSGATSDAGSLDLVVEPEGIFAEIRRRLVRREAPPQLRDAIFLRFSRGEALDQLDLEAPDDFARLVRPGWRSPERLGWIGTGVVSILAAGLAWRFPDSYSVTSNSDLILPIVLGAILFGAFVPVLLWHAPKLQSTPSRWLREVISLPASEVVGWGLFCLIPIRQIDSAVIVLLAMIATLPGLVLAIAEWSPGSQERDGRTELARRLWQQAAFGVGSLIALVAYGTFERQSAVSRSDATMFLAFLSSVAVILAGAGLTRNPYWRGVIYIATAMAFSIDAIYSLMIILESVSIPGPAGSDLFLGSSLLFALYGYLAAHFPTDRTWRRQPLFVAVVALTVLAFPYKNWWTDPSWAVSAVTAIAAFAMLVYGALDRGVVTRPLRTVLGSAAVLTFACFAVAWFFSMPAIVAALQFPWVGSTQTIGMTLNVAPGLALASQALLVLCAYVVVTSRVNFTVPLVSLKFQVSLPRIFRFARLSFEFTLSISQGFRLGIHLSRVWRRRTSRTLAQEASRPWEAETAQEVGWTEHVPNSRRKSVPEFEPLPPARRFEALPLFDANEMVRMVRVLGAIRQGGAVDPAELARSAQVQIYDLMQMIVLLRSLGFVIFYDMQVRLTDRGQEFANAADRDQRSLFRIAALDQIPLLSAIRNAIETQSEYRISETQVRSWLNPDLPDDQADQTIRAAIELGRYAEIFYYDETEREFVIEGRFDLSGPKFS